MKRVFYFLLALGLSATIAAAAGEPAELVGYCAGNAVDPYKSQSCSAADNATLIAQSRIVKGNHNLCAALMNNHWSYLPLDRSHSITNEEAEKYLGTGTVIWPNAGYFDMNNDGKPEYLVWMYLHHAGRAACDIEAFL
jgi:hypothetical protein